MNERLTAKEARELLQKEIEKVSSSANYRECISYIRAAIKRKENYCYIDTLYLDKATMEQLRKDGYEIGEVYEDVLPFGNVTQRKVSF
jgi:hypothetical protein